MKWKRIPMLKQEGKEVAESELSIDWPTLANGLVQYVQELMWRPTTFSGPALQKYSNCCTVNELQWIMTSKDVTTDNVPSDKWYAGWFLSFYVVLDICDIFWIYNSINMW